MASLVIQSFIVIWVYLTTVSCQQPIVVPATIAAGSTFTVYCDINRVTLSDPNFRSISVLYIFWTSSSATTENQIAMYRAFPGPSGIPSNVTNIPRGRNWNFTLVGGNQAVDNRNTMKLTWNVFDAVCEDAGIYRCQVQYYMNDGFEKSLDNTQNVTVVSGATSFDLAVSPPANSFDSVYSDGENITFTCRAVGSDSLTFVWELWYEPVSGSGQYDRGMMPNYVVIDKADPNLITGSIGCLQYNMVSTLSFQVATSDNSNIYKCIVQINNVEIKSGNITIGTTGSTAKPVTAQASDAGTSSDVGMIVGIVIGCVAVIAIIIIVIFVVRYRRRSNEDNYKDREDQPDAAIDNNLHAPPPVFYPSSKPSKVSKEEKDIKIPTGMTNDGLDTSYDSKDSGSKGPPRYANTESDTQGPPRYEKETHRGRQNKGYDEEERERNGGHGRRQPREHEERRHRSRDYDEEPPRRRNYNPDDGTDGRVNFGDPNIGTSI